MKAVNPSVPSRPSRAGLLGNLRVLCAAALLTALSVVLGKYLGISMPLFRISLENLPILMAGIFFGPIIGGLVGVIADLIGCVAMSFTVNPFITLGAALIGILSGLVARFATHGGKPLRPLAICLSVAPAHIVGSMIVKTIGLAIFAHAPPDKLFWRVPQYLVIGTVECILLILLTRNKIFMGQLTRLLARRKGRK